jgi:hypothetical protein
VGKGLDGAFAVGVEVIAAESDAVADVHSGNAIPVSMRALPDFCAGAVGPTNLNWGNVESLTDGIMTPSTLLGLNPQPGMGSGGGFGGGSGGGAGGGIGGGGGLGALLGGLAGGALGYALGNDDDDNPASPGI